MRKQIALTIILAFSFFISTFSQILEPVKWKFSAKRLSEKEAELTFTATIEKGWHLYSQDIPEGGPVATSLSFKESKEYKKIGRAKEPKPITEYDKNFKMTLKYFNHKASFVQKVSLLNNKPLKITGELEFMCCDDEKCLPPALVDFYFNVEAFNGTATVSSNGEKTIEPVEDTVKIIDSTKVAVAPLNETPKADTSKISANKTDEDINNMSLWAFFFFALGGGLIALLTPCIYPMIPMTVSFFMNSSGSKRKSIMSASVYGISIIVIYVLVGTVVAVTLGEEFSSWLSTHWLPNIFFFILFTIFAASFFGMFELTLPSWMINSTDKQADKGGYLGAFFMAFTLVLVSFSCTAPIVGSILALSTQGQVLRPIIGMLGFSLAFAIPFTAFAIFPSGLNSLPKSGGWLNNVKVILGFIELALGLKFLSVADQTYHWGYLDREVYIALWIVIFTLMGFYLLGKLKFAHDSDTKFISVPKLLMAIASFTFVMYLFPGMFGAPLKALAGWLPPMKTHDFDLTKIIRENAGSGGGATASTTLDLCEKPKYADKLELPHGLQGYFDLDQALKCSKATGKPIFIDFTGHGCVNCREMEASVWSESQVLKQLKNDYIVVALYVDDKEIMLPEKEYYTSTYNNKLIKTMSAKNFDYQMSKYNANGQPYYVLVDGNGEPLNKPRGYNKDVEAFAKFLEEGKAEYKKRTEIK
ncbi:MAG: cytochrome c biogenesis protein CcdA [Bacteroidota bacterium]